MHGALHPRLLYVSMAWCLGIGTNLPLLALCFDENVNTRVIDDVASRT
jgi:hypothetical protein